MQTTNINIRTDKELKENCERLFESLGLNMSTAINIFLRQSLRVGGLPFEVKLGAADEAKALRSGRDVRKLLAETAEAHETPTLTVYDLSLDGRDLRIAFTKQVLNKHYAVHCNDGSIAFEERIPVGIHIESVNTVICKPSELMRKDVRTVLVISGKPDIICGLDEGIIASAKRYAVDSSTNRLYVMSEKVFDELQF